MNYKQCAKLLLTHENILILTHRNPDGDTVASAAALCCALRRGGRTAFMYPNPQIGDRLRGYVEDYLAAPDYAYKYTVAVDTATAEMLSQGFVGETDLCIDHHPTNSHYAKELLLRSDKSSCGELVLELIRSMNTELTGEEATLLYIALSTDTGCFQYANTNSASFRTAAELHSLGADTLRVNTEFFRKVSPARLALEGMIYSGLKYYRDGRIAVATVTREMLERSGAVEDDCDDLAGLSGRARGSQLNITVREQEDGNCKVSIRSVPGISSSDICAVFGGGGHAMAAGCNIQGSPERVTELLMQVIDEVCR